MEVRPPDIADKQHLNNDYSNHTNTHSQITAANNVKQKQSTEQKDKLGESVQKEGETNDTPKIDKGDKISKQIDAVDQMGIQNKGISNFPKISSNFDKPSTSNLNKADGKNTFPVKMANSKAPIAPEITPNYATRLLAQHLTKDEQVNIEQPTFTTKQDFPAVLFNRNDFMVKLAERCRFTVIGKFSRAMPRMEVIRQSLTTQLQIKGTCKVTHFNYNHVYIDFDNEWDHVMVWNKEKIYINGVPMRLLTWTPTFKPHEETTIAPVWVTLPQLPWHCYNMVFVSKLLQPVGRVLFFDAASQKKTRGSVAKVKVEIDITKERPRHIWIGYPTEEGDVYGDGIWQQIQFEDVPHYCSYCKHQGHTILQCNIRIRDEEIKRHKEEQQNQKKENSNMTSNEQQNQENRGDVITDNVDQIINNQAKTDIVDQWQVQKGKQSKEKGKMVYVPKENSDKLQNKQIEGSKATSCNLTNAEATSNDLSSQKDPVKEIEVPKDDLNVKQDKLSGVVPKRSSVTMSNKEITKEPLSKEIIDHHSNKTVGDNEDTTVRNSRDAISIAINNFSNQTGQVFPMLEGTSHREQVGTIYGGGPADGGDTNIQDKGGTAMSQNQDIDAGMQLIFPSPKVSNSATGRTTESLERKQSSSKKKGSTIVIYHNNNDTAEDPSAIRQKQQHSKSIKYIEAQADEIQLQRNVHYEEDGEVYKINDTQGFSPRDIGFHYYTRSSSAFKKIGRPKKQKSKKVK